jgi:proteasome lid subunit RPN8/RPN11
MKIEIYGVNNKVNEEITAVYDEKELLTGYVRLSDNFASADASYKLILHSRVVGDIFDFIEWDTGMRTDICVEQGGILLGRRYYDSEKGIHFAVVSKAITAEKAIGSSGHLEITHECWRDMHEKKDAYNGESGEDAIIVGWFHTHPNGLSCFMSGTDRNTQNLFFDGDNTYSIVINPQRHLLKAFRSKECYPVQAFLVLHSQ